MVFPSRQLSRETVSQNSESGSGEESEGGRSSASSDSIPDRGKSDQSSKRKRGTPIETPSKRRRSLSATSSSASDNDDERDVARAASSEGGDDESQEESESASVSGSEPGSASNESSSEEMSQDEDSQASPTTQRSITATNGISNGHDQRRSSFSGSADSSNELPSPKAQSTVIRFKPPAGFQRVEKSTPGNGDAIAGLLSTENLAGKQIWHIMAPASIPITSITSASVDESRGGDIIVSYNGAEYSLRPNKMPAETLMVSDDGGATYKPTRTEFSATASIKRIVESRDKTTSATDSQSMTVTEAIPKTKTIPKQPPGLKTRHWPAGFEDHSSDKASHQRKQGDNVTTPRSKSSRPSNEKSGGSSTNLSHSASGEPRVNGTTSLPTRAATLSTAATSGSEDDSEAENTDERNSSSNEGSVSGSDSDDNDSSSDGD